MEMMDRILINNTFNISLKLKQKKDFIMKIKMNIIIMKVKVMIIFLKNIIERKL